MRTVSILLTTSLVGLLGCKQLADNDTSRVKTEIEASVEQASKAWEEFPKSLDRTHLLKHCAADYSGVKDGASETLQGFSPAFTDTPPRPLWAS